jgi:hypothetical protein
VQEYCQRPAFKNHATWALRTLVAGAGTAERRLIESVDAGLVQSARSLLALARQKRMQQRLRALNQQAIDDLPMQIAQTEQIAAFPDAQGRPLHLVETGHPIRELLG